MVWNLLLGIWNPLNLHITTAGVTRGARASSALYSNPSEESAPRNLEFRGSDRRISNP